jgi:outer membrane protein assembly factor BamB
VLAVNWKKREIVWKYKTTQGEFPIHSSAAVTDKFVVVGSRDKQVHCIDRSTGERVWAFPTKARVDSSPVIVGERVFVGSTDGNLYALNLKDGAELWKFNVGKSITGSAAVGEGCLVVGTESSDGMIFCFGAK